MREVLVPTFNISHWSFVIWSRLPSQSLYGPPSSPHIPHPSAPSSPHIPHPSALHICRPHLSPPSSPPSHHHQPSPPSSPHRPHPSPLSSPPSHYHQPSCKQVPKEVCKQVPKQICEECDDAKDIKKQYTQVQDEECYSTAKLPSCQGSRSMSEYENEKRRNE